MTKPFDELSKPSKNRVIANVRQGVMQLWAEISPKEPTIEHLRKMLDRAFCSDGADNAESNELWK